MRKLIIISILLFSGLVALSQTPGIGNYSYINFPRTTLSTLSGIQTGHSVMVTDSNYRPAYCDLVSWKYFAFTTDLAALTLQKAISNGATLNANNTITNTGEIFTWINAGTGLWKWSGLSQDTTNTTGVYVAFNDSSQRMIPWAKFATKLQDYLSVGGSQTWQQTLTTGSTLNTTNNVTNTGQTFTWTNGGTGLYKLSGFSHDTTASFGLLGLANDSSERAFSWAAVAAKISPLLPTFNIFAGNGLTGANGDSIYLGGTLNQNTSITQNAFPITFFGTASSQFNVYSDLIQIFQNSGGLPILLSGLIASGSGSNITSGTSSNAPTNASNVYINPSSTMATYTLTLPGIGTEGSLCCIHFGGTLTSGTVVTSLTISPSAGTTLLQTSAPISAVAGDCFIYRLHGTVWYREQ